MNSQTYCHHISRYAHLLLSFIWLAALSGGILQVASYAQNPVTLTLTSPSTQTSFSTNRNAIVLRGSASSAVGIQQVTWSVRNKQLEGTAKGTANWEVDNVWLVVGTNELIVTALDFAGNQATNTYFITYQPETVAAKLFVTAPTDGQIIAPGSKPLISWYVTGTPSASWTRIQNTLDVQIALYRNGTFVSTLTGLLSGVSNTAGFAFNYPEGDGYQLRVASHEGPGLPGSVEAYSPTFRIGQTGAPTISSFTVVAPNKEPGNSIAVPLGQSINFRWRLGGGNATQQTINNGVGDVTGRDSKIIPTTQVGSVTYTLTVANNLGTATQSVTVNVQPASPPPLPEVLYNGITLDSVWPPKPANYPDTTQLPPYLINPPSLIPINTGRQLFVDDFLIESSTLTRQFHPLTMHTSNPILKATSAVEKAGLGPMATPYSNGVFFDPADKLFKLWYMCGYRINVCYATSTDGIAWNKPNLDVVPGTNIVYKDTNLVDSYTNWIDLDEPNPDRRYKMLRVIFVPASPVEYHLHYSADGIHWGTAATVSKTLGFDAGSFFFNPFRKKWGLALKDLEAGPIRLRRYAEHEDLSFALKSIVPNTPSTAETLLANASKWGKADALDTAHPNDPMFTPNLYALQAGAYESLLLGQFSILRGDGDKPLGRPKINEVYFGFSRDGFYWHRPNRQVMLGVNNTAYAWNWGNVQPVASAPIIVGDQMYFYFSGRAGTLPGTDDWGDSNGATGLATMRRDGFASLNAANTEGSVTTRRITFDGRFLLVNAEIASGGSLCAEILNDNNQPIAPFTKANCLPYTGNATKQMLGWTGANDLNALSGTSVKIRFYLKNGKLFSFWVSPTTEGASRGFLGAGGPSLASYRDTGSTDPLAPSVSLTPDKQIILTGQAATLTFSIANATSAAFTPAIPGCDLTLLNGTAYGTCKPTQSVSGTVNYVLTAQGNGKTVTATAMVTAQSDLTPPVLTLTTPTVSLFPAGTNQVRIELATNENAFCRFSTTPDVAFASVAPLPQTGGLTHSVTVSAATGQSYAYYLRCADTLNNISAPLALNFGVASATNKALQFDGRTGVATFTSTNTAPRSKQWTVETWIKTIAQPTEYQSILGNSGALDIRLSPGPNVRAVVSINTGTATQFVGSKKINDGLWHYLVAVRNNDKLYLYVDGQADTDTETSRTDKSVNSPTGDNELTIQAIGNRGTAAEWYEGQVDDVRLHNRAFTASEVTMRYNNGKVPTPINETNQRLGFSFNEGAGAVLDFASGGYRGTLSGGALRVSSASILASVSAASYLPNTASESIVAAFGSNLASSVQIGRTVPLPTRLGNISVNVRDSLGVTRLAPLFFVSPSQINYQVPLDTAEGLAAVSLTTFDNTLVTGSLNVGTVAPSLFTANANGSGLPAAVALRVKTNGATNYETIVRFDQTSSQFVAQPIDLGPAGEQVYLILYGTGLRGRSALSNTTARFTDVSVTPLFVGASPGFIGLDQINVLIPRTLIARGNVTLTLTVDGKVSNTVNVNIR